MALTSDKKTQSRKQNPHINSHNRRKDAMKYPYILFEMLWEVFPIIGVLAVCLYWPPYFYLHLLTSFILILTSHLLFILTICQFPSLVEWRYVQKKSHLPLHFYLHLLAVLYYISQHFTCWDFVGMTIQDPIFIGMDPNSLRPKPRPSTPRDFFDMIQFQYQNEIVWIIF